MPLLRGREVPAMSHYIDNLPCPRCKKTTPHMVYDPQKNEPWTKMCNVCKYSRKENEP